MRKVFLLTLVLLLSLSVQSFSEGVKVVDDDGKTLFTVDVNIRDKQGRTLLMLAAGTSKNPEQVKYLLDTGAEVNAKDPNGG
ncbi:MAG: hypothetical protein II832_11275, partial [Synergistaceae bacterium]|nr:hypothetical protein [Synergistaceae bacterium]